MAAGFALGMMDLTGGVYRGVSGIVSQPLRGAQRDGVRGFARGVGVGVLGVVVKPVVGVVDLATRMRYLLLCASIFDQTSHFATSILLVSFAILRFI